MNTPTLDIDLEAATLAAVEGFIGAVARRDVAALRQAVAADCIFECPRGSRFVGDDMIAAYAALFATPGMAPFVTEEIVLAGDRAVVRWLVSWDHGDGDRGQLRGVDVFRVRDGAIAEMLSYQKG